MSYCRYLVMLSMFVLSAGPACADGLLYQLPKDGTWATYDVDVSGKADSQDMSVKGKLRIASVGKVTEEGQPCRWIEVQIDGEMAMGEAKHKETETWKVLVPEKYLAKGESPLDHVVRAWRRQGEGESQEMKDPKDIDVGPLPIILSGPWKDIKQLEKVDVESKLGKLNCEGAEGTLEFKMKREGLMKCKLQNRQHPNSPFGAVTSHWTLEVHQEQGPMRQMNMDWKIKLIDLGEDATSAMPDAK